jgi:hypothetical protein
MARGPALTVVNDNLGDAPGSDHDLETPSLVRSVALSIVSDTPLGSPGDYRTAAGESANKYPTVGAVASSLGQMK